MLFRFYKEENGIKCFTSHEYSRIKCGYNIKQNKLRIAITCTNPNTNYEIEIEDDEHEYFHGVLQSQDDYSYKKYDDIKEFYDEYMNQCFGVNKRVFQHTLVLYKYEIDKRGNLHHTLEILL